MTLRIPCVLTFIAAGACVMGGPSPVFAQMNGANILGDFGVDSATQPPPGFWVGGPYYHYRTDTIRNADGSRLVFDAGQPGKLSMPAFAPTFEYVTKGTVFGGHYAVMVVSTFASTALEAPGLALESTTSLGMGDTYIVPAQIGWHLAQADVTTGFAVWAPTGRYTAGGEDNIGRGMWTYDVSAGTTVFLDPRKTWSAATTADFETHGRKEGTAFDVGPRGQMAFGGVRVGDILSLEGGLAREFAAGAAHAGVAYYAQWKLSGDDFWSPDSSAGQPGVGQAPCFRRWT